MRYKKELNKFYWIKADGEVEKINEERFLELESRNATTKTNSYTLIWKMPKRIEFIDKMNTIRVPIDSLKKIL